MEIEQYIHNLRLDKYANEMKKSQDAVLVLENFISKDGWTTAKEVINQLQNVQAEIKAKMPWESTPCNMIDRVIKMVKDEYNTCVREADQSGNISQKTPEILTDYSITEDNPDMSVVYPTLRDDVVRAILELKSEMEQCLELISLQGESKVHSDEVILTCGYCPIVYSFLKRASSKTRFHVIVAQCAPEFNGNKMAKLLGSQKIATTLIADTAIFAMMSRVNKVFIGTRTVLSNGGIKTFVGASLLATAAKYHSVALYVCCPTYLFSLHTNEEVMQHTSPEDVLDLKREQIPAFAHISVTKFDYVPPELITSFITNNQGVSPSSVYRQLAELYHPSTYDV